jgi:hypothetical protein
MFEDCYLDGRYILMWIDVVTDEGPVGCSGVYRVVRNKWKRTEEKA